MKARKSGAFCQIRVAENGEKRSENGEKTAFAHFSASSSSRARSSSKPAMT